MSISRLVQTALSKATVIDPVMAIFVPDTEELGEFVFLPESISDSRSVSYIERNVIGSSHPIYQWTHSGSREISFDVLITKESQSFDLSKLSGAVNAIKNPLSFGISKLSGGGTTERSVVASLGWLRSLTYPRVGLSGKNIISSPPRVRLYIRMGSPNTLSGRKHDVLTIDAIVTDVGIKFDAFFPNGEPRTATASLSFSEITQGGGGLVVSRTGKMFGASDVPPKKKGKIKI